MGEKSCAVLFLFIIKKSISAAALISRLSGSCKLQENYQKPTNETSVHQSTKKKKGPLSSTPDFFSASQARVHIPLTTSIATNRRTLTEAFVPRAVAPLAPALGLDPPPELPVELPAGSVGTEVPVALAKQDDAAALAALVPDGA